MSFIQVQTGESPTEIECVLSASDSYVETLTIRRIEAQPWLTELVIKTQLLNSKNPKEKRVKTRCCIEREQLTELRNALCGYLEQIDTTGVLN
jgi:hypothetical protein